MLSPLLRSQLEPVAHRYRRLQLWRGLPVCWGLSALVGVGLISIYHLSGWWSSLALPALAVATFVCAVVIWQKTRVLEPDFRWVARQIEQQNPELRALLLTAVEQMPKEGAEPLSYLEQRVIKEA